VRNDPHSKEQAMGDLHPGAVGLIRVAIGVGNVPNAVERGRMTAPHW
jgi:hypothetical protein